MDFLSGAYFEVALTGENVDLSGRFTSVSGLNMEVEYDGFHDILPLRVRGKLPEDREKMLKKLDKALGEHGDAPWPTALVD